jgi:hypothetical protein
MAKWPFSFRGLLASSVSQRNGARFAYPRRFGAGSASRISCAKAHLSHGNHSRRELARGRVSGSLKLSCGLVSFNGSGMTSMLREQRLAFEVAGEMNEIFVLERARALAPIRALGRSRRTGLARGGAGDLRSSGFAASVRGGYSAHSTAARARMAMPNSALPAEPPADADVTKSVRLHRFDRINVA